MTATRRGFWITAGLLVLTLGASKLTERRVADRLAAPLESIPRTLDGWSMTGTEVLDAGTLKVLTPTSYLSRLYRKNGRQLGLFVAYYAVQRAGENMHSPKNCLPGSGWDIWRQGSSTIQVQGQPTRINMYSIQRLGQHSLVYYWYQSRQRIVASEFLGKIMLVRDSLVEGHTAGLIARVTVEDLPRDAADGKVFSEQLAGELQRCFAHYQD